MADENQPIGQLSSQEFEKMRQDAISTTDAIKDISKIIGDNARAISEATGDSAAKFKDSFSASNALAKELSNISAEDLKIKGKSQQIEKKVQAALKEQIGLRSKQQSLIRQAAVATGREKELLQGIAELYAEAANNIDAQVDNTKKLYQELKRIDKSVKFFENMEDVVDDIPVLRKFFSEFKQASIASRDAGGGKKGAIAGLKELAGAGFKAGLGFLIKGLADGQTRITEFSRNLMMGREEAQKLNNEFVDLAANSGYTTDQLAAFQRSSAEILGITADFNAENAKSFANLTQRLGMSANEAMNLQLIASGTGKTLQEQSSAIVGQSMALADAAGVAVNYQAVLQDIANVSTATAITSEKFPGGIARAAFEARKFGLTLAQVENSASGLLNFEESIGAELEAELLTGKELSLERARMAALTGDTATLAAELAKNIGTAAEFRNMNVIAQEALANSMGMTREELAQTLARQEALTDLTKEFNGIKLEGKTLDEKVAEIQKAAVAKDGTKLSRAEALAKLGEDELARQEKNMSVQEKFIKAMDDLAQAASKFAKFIDFIGQGFTFISQNASAVLGTMVALGALRFRNIFKLGGVFNKFLGKGGTKAATKSASGVVKDARLPSGFRDVATGRAVSKTTGQAALKTGGKSIGKSIVKKIPLIGALAGLGFAISRAASGDFIGAAGELASGVASTIPGLGTAASVAIDAGLAARDISNATSRSNPGGSSEMRVNDFTLRSNPKDTLVMAGGTRFGEETNALLKELITATKEARGDVLIDGNKAGIALNLAAYNPAIG